MTRTAFARIVGVEALPTNAATCSVAHFDHLGRMVGEFDATAVVEIQTATRTGEVHVCDEHLTMRPAELALWLEPADDVMGELESAVNEAGWAALIVDAA